MPFPAKISGVQVLEAAVALIERDGLDALSMRTLARTLQVQPMSLYRYYAGKQEVEAAVIDYGNAALLEELARAVAGLAPEAAFESAAHAYVKFARERQSLYYLMMDRRLVFPPKSDSGKALWNFVLGLLAPISGEPDDTARAVALWSFLHGYCALERAGRFGESGPKEGFSTGIQSLLQGFQRGSAPLRG